MQAMTSGVFFRRPPSAAGAPHPVDLDGTLDQLPPARSDRRRVDAEQSGDAPVAAPPALERFEAGEQAPLPLGNRPVRVAARTYPGTPRRVGYRDEETRRSYVFVTNNTTWVGKTNCRPVQVPGQIEPFFVQRGQLRPRPGHPLLEDSLACYPTGRIVTNCSDVARDRDLPDAQRRRRPHAHVAHP